MQEIQTNKRPSPIVYSCYHTRSRQGEQFIPEHVFTYHIAGLLTVSDGTKTYTFGEGEFRLSKRNHLAKFTKQPPEGGEFRSLSIFLDQETLRKVSVEYGYQAEKQPPGDAVLALQPHPLLKNYMASLLPYQQMIQSENEDLLALKLREAILILLRAAPELKDFCLISRPPARLIWKRL